MAKRKVKKRRRYSPARRRGSRLGWDASALWDAAKRKLVRDIEREIRIAARAPRSWTDAEVTDEWVRLQDWIAKLNREGDLSNQQTQALHDYMRKMRAQRKSR